MTSKQKILWVLRHIKDEREIKADSSWITYEFNLHVVGSGIVSADDELKILFKLKKENIIDLELPKNIDVKEVTRNGLSSTKMCNGSKVKILPKFARTYYWYSIVNVLENKWNYINPFWLVFQLLKGLKFLIEYCFQKNKIITIIFSVIAGLLVYDWTLAWQNLKIIIEFFKTL